jgi:hypothetical protein
MKLEPEKCLIPIYAFFEKTFRYKRHQLGVHATITIYTHTHPEKHVEKVNTRIISDIRRVIKFTK